MLTPHHLALRHYQSSNFAEKYMLQSRENYDSAHQSLRETFERLRETYLRLSPALCEAMPLSQLIDGPLSIGQLIAMIRTYAHKLSSLLA